MITTQAAALSLSLSPRTIARWAHLGRIRSHTLSLPVDLRPLSSLPGGRLPGLYFVPAELRADLSGFERAAQT